MEIGYAPHLFINHLTKRHDKKTAFNPFEHSRLFFMAEGHQPRHHPAGIRQRMHRILQLPDLPKISTAPGWRSNTLLKKWEEQLPEKQVQKKK